MPISSYGVLVGKAINKLDSAEAQQKGGGDPHYMIHIDANGTSYRLAVNVKSDNNPPDLQYYLDTNYQHPILDAVKQLQVGFTAYPNNLPAGTTPNTAALDYVQGNLFDFADLKILPATATGPNNDLNDIFDIYVSKAISTEGALVYAFGSKWGPETAADAFFDFTPGNGIHDIHMNQANGSDHANQNGHYTDGGLLIFYPDTKQWVAMFLKFQSQIVAGQPGTGGGTGTGTGAGGSTTTPPPAVTSDVTIFAALVNPGSDDVGHEAVYLLNTTDTDIALDGWAIVDKNNKKEVLSGKIAAGAPLVHVLSGKTTQLSNNGGIISLLDKNGVKISGVSYTKDQAGAQGKVIVF